MMTDAEPLLPCPFCGGEACRSEGLTGDGKPWPYIECEECGACNEPDQWNTRTVAAPVVSREDALDALDETMIYLKCLTDKTKQTINTLLEAAAKETNNEN